MGVLKLTSEYDDLGCGKVPAMSTKILMGFGGSPKKFPHQIAYLAQHSGGKIYEQQMG